MGRGQQRSREVRRLGGVGAQHLGQLGPGFVIGQRCAQCHQHPGRQSGDDMMARTGATV